MTDTYYVPQLPWFTQFFQHWQRSPERILIRDLETGKEASVTEFLYDVIRHGSYLRSQLSEEIQSQLRDPNEEVFIAIVASAGYEFVVLFFAIYSLGAIAVPLRPHVHPEEANYFLGICNTVLITSSRLAAGNARLLSTSLQMSHFVFSPSEQPRKTNIQFLLGTEQASYTPERGFVLIYSSGTTGPPKGVLYSCQNAILGVKNSVGLLGLSSNDTWLHHMPAHWRSGFDNIIVAAYTGAYLEFCSNVFSPAWFWQRMSCGGISCMRASPLLLSSLQESLEEIRHQKSDDEYKRSVRGLQDIRLLCAVSMRVSDTIKEAWKELLSGRQLVIVYGTTEVAGMISATDWKARDDIPSDSCGSIASQLIAKVNDEGEICLKGPLIMKRYISGNANVMDNVFDSSDFYKTGDLGRIGPGRDIFVLGRARQDVIRYFGWKVNALDVEESIRQHPEVSQTFVLGIADEHTCQRVAALIVRKPVASCGSFKLAALRRWLAIEQKLPAFKLPTMLRTISKGDPIPMTDSGKPLKKKIEDVYFRLHPVADRQVEIWDITTQEEGIGNRQWDWEGGSAK